MATEQQPKSPNGHADQIQQQPPPPPVQHALTPALAYPPQFGGHFPPPPGYPGPFYTYAPMPDGAHDPNAPSGMPSGPYLVAYPPPPPGMMYAFSPPGFPGYPPFPPGIQTGNAARPKRKQVKMACTNCAGACKRCDEARPCERCKKYGIADSCVDGIRKERKKGVKRGPYKRKSKTSGDAGAASPNGESTESPPVSQTTYVPAEYSYPAPYYVPQPYGFAPPPHQDGHSSPHGEEGHPSGNVHPQTIPHPMFPLHPAVYPTYPPYPYATAPPQGVIQAPPNSVAVSVQQEKASETADDASKSKKRGRPNKGDESAGSKEKRVKPISSSAEDSSPENNHTAQYVE